MKPDEIVPVQIRIWFRDGGYYDLRGTLGKIETDRTYDPVDFSYHKIYREAEVRWSLEGTLAKWEFMPDGRPDLLRTSPSYPQLGAAGLGRSAWKAGDPDRSQRARKRARARARKQRDAKAVHRDRPAGRIGADR